MGLLVDSGYERISNTFSVYSAKKISKKVLLFAKIQNKIFQPPAEAEPEGGEGGSSPGQILIPNLLIIEIIGFCLTTSSHKSNFHANHTHRTRHAQ